MTLKELGYTEVIDCAGIHYFKGNKYIEISEYNKGIKCGNTMDRDVDEYLTIDELKAIIKENEEHKWL